MWSSDVFGLFLGKAHEVSILVLSFSWIWWSLTNSSPQGESCTCKWGQCLGLQPCKPCNHWLGCVSLTERFMQSPGSGQEVAVGRRQAGKPWLPLQLNTPSEPWLSREDHDLLHHLLKTSSYKGQIIHLALLLPALFFCQLTFQEPLEQRAANYFRNSNRLLLW